MEEELEILPNFAVIKLVNIDIRKGQRIIINDFELINDIGENFAIRDLFGITLEFLKNIQQEKDFKESKGTLNPSNEISTSVKT